MNINSLSTDLSNISNYVVTTLPSKVLELYAEANKTANNLFFNRVNLIAFSALTGLVASLKLANKVENLTGSKKIASLWFALLLTGGGFAIKTVANTSDQISLVAILVTAAASTVIRSLVKSLEEKEKLLQEEKQKNTYLSSLKQVQISLYQKECITELESRIENYEEENSILKEQVTTLQQEKEQLTDTIDKDQIAHNKQIVNLESKSKTKNDLIQLQNEELDDLRKNSLETLDKIVLLEQQISALKKEKSDLEKDASDALLQKAEVQQEVSELKRTVGIKQDGLETVEKKLEEVVKCIEIQLEQTNLLNNQLEDVRQQLKTANQQLEATHQELEAAHQELEAAQKLEAARQEAKRTEKS